MSPLPTALQISGRMSRSPKETDAVAATIVGLRGVSQPTGGGEKAQ